MLSDDYKGIENLYTFKNKIEKWKPKKCPCLKISLTLLWHFCNALITLKEMPIFWDLISI